MTADIRVQIVALLPRLRRFARGLSGSASEADDLVQGTCERALRAIESWQRGTRLDSWLFRILRNLWIDDLRKKRRFADADEALDPPGVDGRSVVEAHLDLARVRATIAELSAQQREVLVLVCIEDFSYRETAAILDVPIGTVMSRLARARMALAGRLGEGAEGQRRAEGLSR
jgi:RNA polymerase sigma-70 factor (ECF subfamily)